MSHRCRCVEQSLGGEGGIDPARNVGRHVRRIRQCAQQTPDLLQ
ncbi:hypothetical protein ACIQVL_16610 [Streptomyces sp. NPDC090499]